MVHVSTPRPNLGAALGNALGSVGGKIAGQEYGRYRTKNDIENLRNKSQGASPQDLAFNLAEIAAMNPQAARAIGPIAQTLIPMAKANVSPSPNQIIPGGLTAQGNPPNLQQPQQQFPSGQIGAQGNAPQNFANPALAEGTAINLGSFLPYDLGAQISPERKMEILDEVAKKGGDVDFTRSQIEDYNAGKISQIDLANSNVEKQAAQMQRQFNLESQVAQYLEPKLPANTDEQTKVLYQNMMAKNLPSSKGLNEAFSKTQREINNFEKQRKTWIKNVPEGNIYGIPKGKEKQLHSSAKPMLSLDPAAYNILESAMVQKGNSIIDASHTLKPITPELSNVMKEAKDFRDVMYPKFNISEIAMMKNIQGAQADQGKEVPKLTNDLGKIWNDGISLLNIYTDLSRKGWFPEQINMLFDQLSSNFDAQQKVEHTQLIEHPRIPIRYLTE